MLYVPQLPTRALRLRTALCRMRQLLIRWAVNHLRDLFQEYNLPTNDVAFVTDHEFMLMGALHDIFPNANMLLCRWHINKIISAKHKKASQQKLGKHF